MRFAADIEVFLWRFRAGNESPVALGETRNNGSSRQHAKFPNLQKNVRRGEQLSLNPLWLRVNRDYAFMRARRRKSFGCATNLIVRTLIIIIGLRGADYTPLVKEINLYSQEKRHVWLYASGPKIIMKKS